VAKCTTRARPKVPSAESALIVDSLAFAQINGVFAGSARLCYGAQLISRLGKRILRPHLFYDGEATTEELRDVGANASAGDLHVDRRSLAAIAFPGTPVVAIGPPQQPISETNEGSRCLAFTYPPKRLYVP